MRCITSESCEVPLLTTGTTTSLSHRIFAVRPLHVDPQMALATTTGANYLTVMCNNAKGSTHLS